MTGNRLGHRRRAPAPGLAVGCAPVQRQGVAVLRRAKPRRRLRPHRPDYGWTEAGSGFAEPTLHDLGASTQDDQG
jgi:hypothetical protein